MATAVPSLCRPSALYEDWVVKGFHLYIKGVELAVRPGHKAGMIVFKRIFRSDALSDIDAAARLTRQSCLSLQVVRETWVQTLGRAMDYLNGYDGDLQEKANGRKYEFRRLQKALLVFGKD
ncbi:MAG TPA: hypothetical protein VGB55_01370 [Tepidisphaeraceae bacterium]|jgi:hypothetical protein